MTVKQAFAILVATALITLPVSASVKQCPAPGPVTIEREARQLRRDANQLGMLARNPGDYKASHRTEVLSAKDSINKIAANLCRLQEISRVSEPWQQANIEAVVAATKSGVADAEEAIRVVVERDYLSGSYQQAAASLYNGAKELAKVSQPGWVNQYMEAAD
jgi:hypothetical protein